MQKQPTILTYQSARNGYLQTRCLAAVICEPGEKSHAWEVVLENATRVAIYPLTGAVHSFDRKTGRMRLLGERGKLWRE